MFYFKYGPANGVTLDLRRAPIYLRVTVAGELPGPVRFDALDLADDEAGPGEKIYAYKRIGKPTGGMLDYTDSVTRRRRGRPFLAANYAFVEDQPDDDVLRDNSQWQAWCLLRNEADKEKEQQGGATQV